MYILEWGSATIDWCEPNYEWTWYIAELWNTLSSFSMVILGMVMVDLYYRKGVPRYITVSHFMLMLMGFGSVYFHGTLSFAGQLVDELTMVWYILFTMPEMTRQPKTMRILAIAVAAWYTNHAVHLVTQPTKQVQFFQRTFISCTILILFKVYILTRSHIEAKNQLEKVSLALSLATIVWSIDRFACDELGHLYLHAVWHVLASVALYYLSHLQVFLHLNKNNHGDKVVFEKNAWQIATSQRTKIQKY